MVCAYNDDDIVLSSTGPSGKENFTEVWQNKRKKVSGQTSDQAITPATAVPLTLFWLSEHMCFPVGLTILDHSMWDRSGCTFD